MNDILKSKYIKTNISKQWLIQNGFRYNKSLSEDEFEIYTYKFTVHKYKSIPVLICELSIDLKTGTAIINVFDENDNMYYPFYHINCGNYDPLIESINKKITKKLNTLGIKKVCKSCK